MVMKKILCVLDKNCRSSRSEADVRHLMTHITEVCKEYGYLVDFNLFNVHFGGLDIDIDSIQNMVDVDSTNACMNEYAFVISEGLSAYFWLQSICSNRIVCVNPIIDLRNVLDDVSDVMEYAISEHEEMRGFATESVFCILSNERISELQSMDNLFKDGTVIPSKADSSSDKFWNFVLTLCRMFEFVDDGGYVL